MVSATTKDMNQHYFHEFQSSNPIMVKNQGQLIKDFWKKELIIQTCKLLTFCSNNS